jgi:chromosome segregation ATPase
MRKAKDVQDEQLELAERQKAVEEARNELQNAQNERTIRYFNAQKGQWEWMADKGRIADAEEALSAAEKDLADYEYEMRIKALESQIEQIESVYQDRIDEIEDTQLSNDDRIYDLEQQLLALEDAYNNAIEPYEAKMTELERQLRAIEEQWAEAEMPYNAPEDDLSRALANIGGTGAEKNAVSSAIKALQSVANGNYSSVAQAAAKTVSVAPTKSTSA